MPDQIDLEPKDYSVKGRKEPILAKGWWLGVLAIAILMAIGFAKFSLVNWSIGH